MIQGEDKLNNHLKKYENISLRKPVQRATQLVCGAAQMLCIASSGELRDSISTSIEDTADTATGTCYTNKAYAAYVEFGTGPKGQKNHNGISPNLPIAYRLSPWWIHESQVDKELAEKYHWTYIDTPDGRFYQCTGQPARPFMYPALKNQEEALKKMIADEVKEQMK